MKKPQIRSIITHFVHDEKPQSLSERITDFHIQIIERRLNNLNVTTKQKLAIIDQIIVSLKTGESQSYQL